MQDLRTFKLNQGIEMPTLGLGVYKTLDETEMQNAVDWAVEAGYRSFDTAQMYQNEQLLGKALKRNGADRARLFLTSKILMENMAPEKLAPSYEKSLEKLQTAYLDLLLIHWPGQDKLRLQHAWDAMCNLYHDGKVRAIGVCNCVEKHLKWLHEVGDVMPAVNQVERHPLLNDTAVKKACDAYEIRMEAWSPLLRGKFALPKIVEIAARHGKTPAQVVLRWDIQSGYIVIPKSVHKERIFENADLYDFALTDEEIRQIDALSTGERIGALLFRR